MNILRTKTLLIYSLAVGSISVSSNALGQDLQQNGSIRVGKTQKREYSNLAKISIQDAVTAATKKVPGKVIEAELESEDGYLVYEVKVISPDKQVTEVLVDAGNSAILGLEREIKYFG
jgi:uncharacterized membrane protein YkoI